MIREAYVYDAVRTPRGKGKKDGSLHEVKPMDLLKGLFHAVQERNDLDTETVDDVVLGVVSPVGEQGADIARFAPMMAGWPQTIAGVQINRFCAGGLDAVNLCAMKVRSGWEDLLVAGGVDSMSRVPMGSDGGAWLIDPAVSNEMGFVSQGIGADLIATMEGFSREDVDAFALRSQKRAAHARENGYFNRSIVPVKDLNGITILEQDEFIKPDATMEGLGNLKPAFEMPGSMGFNDVVLRRYPEVERVNHVHTAGNSSGIVDGAALVLVGSKEAGEAMGVKPRARIVAGAVIGSEPTIMLVGPVPASLKALKKAGMTTKDIDLFELNEAFASVVLKYQKDLEIDDDIINVNGGAIAMGHPLGATGSVLLGTMIDELERRDLSTGLITLCAGGGMGIATIIERV